MTITPAQAADDPLLTEADMLRRIEELLAPAIHHGELWILFLDRRRCQLPLMVPIEDMPSSPAPGDADMLVGALAELGEQYDSVILVIERLGPDAVTATDRRWAAALRSAAARRQVAIAGVFVLSAHRVRPVPA